MSSRAELNGQRGLALSFSASSGRYAVALDGAAAARPLLALKPASVVPEAEAPTPQEVSTAAEGASEEVPAPPPQKQEPAGEDEEEEDQVEMV